MTEAIDNLTPSHAKQETEASILQRLNGYVEIISNDDEEVKALDLLSSGNKENVAHPSITKERLQEDLANLQTEKDSLLLRLEESATFLSSTPVGMDASLLDADGFPRNDCDLYAVRQARQTILCSRHSLADVQDKMMLKLQLLHLLTKPEANQQMKNDHFSTAHEEQTRKKELERAHLVEQYRKEEKRVSQLEPLLVVFHVDDRSPAYEGGLRPGQQILEFGGINVSNLASRSVPEILRGVIEDACEHRSGIPIWLRATATAKVTPAQQGELKQHFIVPTNLEGRSNLGCTLELYTPSSSVPFI